MAWMSQSNFGVLAFRTFTSNFFIPLGSSDRFISQVLLITLICIIFKIREYRICLSNKHASPAFYFQQLEANKGTTNEVEWEVLTEAQSFADCKQYIRLPCLPSGLQNFWNTLFDLLAASMMRATMCWLR